MKKGEWYKYDETDSYFKINYIKSGKYYFTECINMGTYFEKQDWWYINELCTKASISELSNFLPRKHVDLKKKICQIY